MTRPLLLALLWALAALTLARSLHRPALRRGAAGLLVLALADVARLHTGAGGWPRLDVVLSMLWPAAAAALIAGPLPGLVAVVYAVGLAVWGRRLADHWQAALQLPRYAVGALATVMAWRRLRKDEGPGSLTPPPRTGEARSEPFDGRGQLGGVEKTSAGFGEDPVVARSPARQAEPTTSWTASQRIGLLLAAGQVALVLGDAAERALGLPGVWSRWEVVRLVSAAFYVLIAVEVLREPRAR